MILSWARVRQVAERLRRCSGSLDSTEATGLLHPDAVGSSIHPYIAPFSRRGVRWGGVFLAVTGLDGQAVAAAQTSVRRRTGNPDTQVSTRARTVGRALHRRPALHGAAPDRSDGYRRRRTRNDRPGHPPVANSQIEHGNLSIGASPRLAPRLASFLGSLH